MKLTGTLQDYTQTEIDEMGKRIGEFLETLKEVAVVLDVQMTNPAPPKEGENVLYLDFRPFAEFQRLQETEMAFHEILEAYENWNNTLWEQTHLNVGNYRNPKVMAYIMKLRFMVCTFQNFFATSPKEPSPGPSVG